MFAKIVVIACVQFALFDVIASQYIKNIAPGCGCGCGVDVVGSPLLFNQYANVVPGLASGLVAPGYLNGQYALPAANVIQDNSVANNLANTLQLLLVSNLLSNTLPATPDLILPPCACGNGLSYIY